MKTLIDKREVEVDGTTTPYYDLACQCGFLSEGWPQRKLAEARRDQHLAEHETGEPAPDKRELLVEHENDRAARGIAEALAQRRG